MMSSRFGLDQVGRQPATEEAKSTFSYKEKAQGH